MLEKLLRICEFELDQIDMVINVKQECGPMPNVMVALPTTGGAVCSTPQFG